MRIGFFGGGPQALAALQAIARVSGWTVAFVHARFENDPIISGFAQPRGVAVLAHARVNSPEAVAQVRSIKPDVIVSVNAKAILSKALRACAPLGAINLHNGLLPAQGGGGGAYAAIVNGEPCGMTVHFMEDEIDSGDIISQKEIRLSDSATMGDFKDAFVRETPELIVASIRAIEEGGVKRIPQVGRPFYYVPAKSEWDELINWSEPARRIYDRVRARSAGPKNFYLCDGRIYRVLSVALEPLLLPVINTVGQVIRRDRVRGVLVKTGDSGIWVNRIVIDGEDRERVPDHRIGTMLCQNIEKTVFDLQRAVRDLKAQLDSLKSGSR